MSRDYDDETANNVRKYAYDFDYDVMHGYMIKAFSEFFEEGNVLELGCYQGEFTKRLVQHFSDVTCVEASAKAITIARDKTELQNVTFYEALFEEAQLPKKYSDIFLTHVLEHIDDRVGLLKKIKEKWLADDGVLFVACPNAYAPSRQIAVKMGLIDSPEAITAAEWQHGHRMTYSMKTLEKDIISAGMTIKYKSGIFFKALANFQWDMLLSEDKVISGAYLDGCYELGREYPDLCASIFFVCTK